MTVRSTWTVLTDQQLLDQCAVDTYRASGPGGQKRNKTSSAVRLRHLPSGLMVIAEESRSQHENRARALKRLRQRLYLKLREAFPPDRSRHVPRDDYLTRSVRTTVSEHEDLLVVLRERGLKLRLKEEGFWPAVGVVLDALEAHQGRVGDAAETLGVSTGQIVSFLQTDPKVWEQANAIRAEHGHKLLRA